MKLHHLLFCAVFSVISISFIHASDTNTDANDAVTSEGSTTCRNGTNTGDTTGGGCD